MGSKKMIRLIAAVVLLLTLTACSSGEDDPAGTTTEADAVQTITTVTDMSDVSSISTSETSHSSVTKTSDKSTKDSKGTTSVTNCLTTTSTSASSMAAPNVAVGKQNLSNTAYKLKKEKKLTVGFIGGSVTVGTGASSSANGWRMKTVEWLKSTYSADIEQVNASMGGTGSYYGLMRADANLLTGKPDLVFVEFAINDSYLNYSSSESARYMESLVRKCYQSNPNMDIVFVYTTNQNKKGAMTNWIRAFNTVASHYGLITIDAGASMKEKIGTGNWADYYSDTSHPNDAGHDLIFQSVNQAIKSGIDEHNSATALRQHDIPSVTREDLLLDTTMIHAADIAKTNTDVTVNAATYEAPNGSLRLSAGQSMTVSFEGRTVGVYWDRASRYSNNVECVVDGRTTVTKNLCTSSSGSYQHILFDGLTSGTHTLTITNKGSLPVKINELFVSK